MRENKLRAMLDAGEPTLGTRIHSVWPGVVEALGHTRVFDYVEFLAEYAPFDLHDLEGLCRAAELYDLGSIVKVDQEPRTFLAQRGIGAGFQGVLFADCRSAADARACVAAARPETPEHRGTYGVGMRRMAYMGYGGSEEYVAALERVVVGVMIEKQGAVDELDEILAVPGIGLVQFGPLDYAMSTGRVGEARGEEVKAVERHVIERCLAVGVPVRAEIASPSQAEHYRELGVRHFSLGVDLTVLFEWWRENGAAVRQIVSAP
ncbi:MAG TPA: aldolase/citrate lyase family protein [Acidimicrobiia bacterium]|nr:aldolase/citrate lyase family protein [Acidimicrobiia bacterium]